MLHEFRLATARQRRWLSIKMILRHNNFARRAGFLRAVRTVAAATNSAWLLDLLIIHVVTIALAAATIGFDQLLQINPNPIWASVLIVTCRHGVVPGLVAACVGTVLQGVIQHTGITASEDYYSYADRIWRDPILWIVAAVTLGSIRDYQESRLHDVHQAFVRARLQKQTLASRVQAIQQRCIDLERQAAISQTPSAAAVVDMLHELQSADRDRLAAVFAEAVRLTVGPARYTLMHLKGDRFVPDPAFVSGPASGEGAVAITALPPLLETELLRGSRVLSVSRAADLALLGGAGLMAVSVPAPSSTAVVGVLIVTSLAPQSVSHETEHVLRVLCQNLGFALSRDRVVVPFNRERGVSREAPPTPNDQDDAQQASRHRANDSAPTGGDSGYGHFPIGSQGEVA